MSSALSQRIDDGAFVALGSNLGNSADVIRKAIEHLTQLSSEPIIESSLWRTSPVECPPSSADFINAMVGLTPIPTETAETLLAKLQALEKTFGRKPKTVLNEARPLDLDLITFRNEVRNTPNLTLPHPRAHLRRFVLQPLAEIAPDLVIPGQKKSVRELLSALRTDEVITKV
jgi:2-amino-4-hydroxy-6-hydroxymethyldihydropteridine diphosphokinase